MIEDLRKAVKERATSVPDMKILSVVGARPNFMKIAPIILEIKKFNEQTSGLSQPIQHVLVHTGQHYDEVMSDLFFKDLNIPKPDVSLGVGSGFHAIQTAEIMKKFESVVLQEKPDIMIVVGDVNSTLACALVASKILYNSNGARPLIAHVEAGLRSFDRSMPEEINRIVTDHLSDFLFVTEESGIRNLKKEGIPEKRIYFVGNTMIDTLFSLQEKAKGTNILQELGLNVSNNKNAFPYALLTFHRPSNVDDKEKFLEILESLRSILGRLMIIFPAHPRTQRRIEEFNLESYFEFIAKYEAESFVSRDRITLIDPLGYLDFLCLMKNAAIILTDSGGIQEESTCLGISCITLRENTERPVTVSEGTNVIAGIEKDRIVKAVYDQLERKFKYHIPKYWDGKAATRILRVILRTQAMDSKPITREFRKVTIQ
jgi:UDP-N-acetylglucosamine 2-epimerase (non-hydrolysing)